MNTTTAYCFLNIFARLCFSRPRFRLPTGREMAKAWHEANKDLLEFKDAVIKCIIELEDQHKELKDQLNKYTNWTALTAAPSSQPPPLSPTTQTRTLSSSSDGLFISNEPMPWTSHETTAGATEAHHDGCPCALLGGKCLGTIGRIDLYDTRSLHSAQL